MSRPERMTRARGNDAHPGASRRRRQLSPRAVGAVAAGVSIITALLTTGPLAGATPTYKYYKDTATPAAPSAIYVGVASPISVTLNNLPFSNQPFGSAEILLNNVSNVVLGQPASVPPLPVTDQNWTATLVSAPTTGSPSAVVLLTSTNALAIQPGHSLNVYLTITPAADSNITAGTIVKQSNDFSGTGNNFKNQGTDPTILVDPVTIAFVTQPTDVQQSFPNAKSPTFNYMCDPVSKQPVTVSAMAGSTPVAGVSVTITDTSNSGLYYGTALVGASGVTLPTGNNGEAIFSSTGDCTSGFAATNLGSGFTLTATSPAASGSLVSDPFSVVQFLGLCGGGPCGTPNPLVSPTNGTTGSINGTFGTSGELIGSFGQGPLTCDNQVTTSAVKADPFESKAFGTASGYITITFPKSVVNNLANNGTPLMQVCAGASAPFPALSPPGLLDTGVVGSPTRYQGLLADCTSNPPPPAPAGEVQICVVSRSKNAANEIIQIFSSDLSDPHYW